MLHACMHACMPEPLDTKTYSRQTMSSFGNLLNLLYTPNNNLWEFRKILETILLEATKMEQRQRERERERERNTASPASLAAR